MKNIQSSKCRINRILEQLGSYFGAVSRPDEDPLNVLIRGILSQNTSDSNSGKAFNALLKKYKNWDKLRLASNDEVIETIKVSGLARQKTESIKNALNYLEQEWGGCDLIFLNEMSIEQAEKTLTSIKGIGIKTARLVLLFGFGRPAFVVDTHVWRVCKRIGLIDIKCSRNKAHTELSHIIPAEKTYSAHMHMIALGRKLCKPRNPLCDNCPVYELCLHRSAV